MATQVIKKDGTKEPFEGERLRKSIEVAAINASSSMDEVSKITNKVLNVTLGIAAKKDEIATSELGESVFNELNKIKPEIAEIWKRHEKEKIHSQDHPFISKGNYF